MSRRTALSGFPEWLPQQRMIEQWFIERIRHTFELHGFAPLETRAVEPIDQLLRKGDTANEIYAIRRLADDGSDDATLGLHFDLTVPFARYIMEKGSHLQFPFRRYQIQKVWRGERPQEGRFREFLQADIDVIDRGRLAFHHEVELPLVIADALRGLPIPPIRMHVNNRKLSEGYCRGLGLPDPAEAIRIIDRLERAGPDAVRGHLVAAGATAAQAKACVAFAGIQATDTSFVEAIGALGVADPLLDQGMSELVAVMQAAAEQAPGLMVADMKIARGLDYYTGTVYETFLDHHEELGSVCSGGRYDDLAGSDADRFPGVGLSIGVSRLLSELFRRDHLVVSRQVPTCVLVAVPEERLRPACARIADALRRRGIPTEVAPTADKYGKQIRYADRRGIPYVWFWDPASNVDMVRDIRSGKQVEADRAGWAPPPADAFPTVAAAGEVMPARRHVAGVPARSARA
jgi:histidyl-tRNA synthetase